MSEDAIQTTPKPPKEEGVDTLLRPIPYEPSLLERVAVSYLRRRSDILDVDIPPPEDPVHVLTPQERAQINRIVRNTVLRSLFAGLSNALIIALLDIFLTVTNAEALQRYLILGLIGAFTTTIEILYLYRSHLIAVHDLTLAAGADLFETNNDIGEMLARVLGRAALELPDPVQVIEGINPRKDVSRVRLALAVILYKLKRGLTNFFLKLLIRRVATRGVLRSAVPLVALPVTGAWNALVSYRILREARMRVIGPSAVKEMTDILFTDLPPLSEEGRVMLLRAVGVVMVRKRRAHPNLIALLRALASRIGAVRAIHLDDGDLFLEKLPHLEPKERELVLAVLQIGAILDGSLSRRDRELLKKSRALCGLFPDLLAAESLLRSFSMGDPIYPGALDALIHDRRG